ncbi:MAG: 2-succinyl-5-enolpyruvyl-6-hydroxy-3-cyclohexene-1-carboxylic-acid synthase [Candidatus Nanopelagicales bacterium]
MNSSTELARVVLTELLDAGVTDVVLAPGSRSAPLALALAAAERRGDLTLHVRIDERSAGFLALGLARIQVRPVAVVCTSGTAVANLAPAVVEATYAGVPLIAITADRPPVLRKTGANQTIDQVGFFSTQVCCAVDIPLGPESPADPLRWHAQVRRVIAAAAGLAGDRAQSPGAVQLNLGFAAPLTPDGDDTQTDGLATAVTAADDTGLAGQNSSPARGIAEPINYALADIGRSSVPTRGIVLVGDVLDEADSLAAIELANSCGWPLISEPSGNALRGPTAVPAASELLGDARFLASHRVDLVVSIGRFGLSRSTMELVKSADQHIAVGLTGRDRPDPARTAVTLLSRVPLPVIEDPLVTWTGPDDSWNRSWQAAAAATAEALDDVLAGTPFGGLQVSRVVVDSLGRDDLLLAAASRTVRDVEVTLRPSSNLPRIIGNRGVSGIDGLASTAWGAALASGQHVRTIALMGDLAFLHDHNGLLHPREELQPNLTIVVVDNNGGGLFSSLEQAAPEFAQDFERVFGTPHDVDLAGIARAAGLRTLVAEDRQELIAALAATAGGLAVIVVNSASRLIEQGTRDLVHQRVDQSVKRLLSR